jgi:hypothetical protein
MAGDEQQRPTEDEARRGRTEAEADRAAAERDRETPERDEDDGVLPADADDERHGVIRPPGGSGPA